MTTPSAGGGTVRRSGPAPETNQVSFEHYLHVLLHRKWLILLVFFVISASTVFVVGRLPDIYTSETVILVDPQKVPETYVKSTVTGDIRNRLGTLSQQILSATRLQKIIDTLNLYPEERKTMAREDVIARMRSNIAVTVLSEFGGGQDLQAFRITYNGKEPRLVAQVTNELASLFIEENLKAREQQATGTADFLENQLLETRKTLEDQESKLRDFKLKHVGEMPEQQTADLQILGQLQSQIQLETEALTRAEQQRMYIQSVMASSAPVVDLDPVQAVTDGVSARPSAGPSTPASLANARARLAELLTRYTDKHPSVQKLKKEVELEEAKLTASAPAEVPPQSSSRPEVAAKSDAPPRVIQPPAVNPILKAQLEAAEAEITKHKQERDRLSKLTAGYQSKLEAIPLREQEITRLARDYEMSKAHYAQLLDKQLSAQTATQLEIRQKGERFSILDPAQPAERPSRPNRLLLNLGGTTGGLLLAIVLALGTEFLGFSITSAEQIKAISGIPVLEVIPRIETAADRRRRRRQLVWAAASGLAVSLVASGLIVVYRFRF